MLITSNMISIILPANTFILSGISKSREFANPNVLKAYSEVAADAYHPENLQILAIWTYKRA